MLIFDEVTDKNKLAPFLWLTASVRHIISQALLK